MSSSSGLKVNAADSLEANEEIHQFMPLYMGKFFAQSIQFELRSDVGSQILQKIKSILTSFSLEQSLPHL